MRQQQPDYHPQADEDQRLSRLSRRVLPVWGLVRLYKDGGLSLIAGRLQSW